VLTCGFAGFSASEVAELCALKNRLATVRGVSAYGRASSHEWEAKRHHDGVSATEELPYGPPPPGGFYAFRPIAVPADLDALQGPLSGVVQLPSHIDTSARAWYDLADIRRRGMLYAVVILEAWRDEDFAAWLNRDALIELWPDLQLPRPVRARWEAKHPVLAARRAEAGLPAP
jgi:hypothetical protein